jgi:hypothetical protein
VGLGAVSADHAEPRPCLNWTDGEGGKTDQMKRLVDGFPVTP